MEKSEKSCKFVTTKCKMIPNNWKKLGAVYLNACGRCVFVCLFCLESVENVDSAFTTYDGSALWSHIKEYHISVDTEKIEEPPAKRPHLETDEKEYLQNEKKNSQSTELTNSVENEENQKKSLTNNEFQRNLVGNVTITESKELHRLDEVLKEKSLLIASDNESTKVEKVEGVEKKTYSNSNYYYDDRVYTISDDDDDEEDDEICESLGHLESVKERRVGDYFTQNKLIELSDDEDDEDQIKTRSNYPLFAKDKAAYAENNLISMANYNNHPCVSPCLPLANQNNLFTGIQSGGREENILKEPFSQNTITHSFHGIPTPDVSPCTSVANQYITTDMRYQCKFCPERFYEVSQLDHHQRQHMPSQGVKEQSTFRPFRCMICHRRTATEQAMQIHQTRFHSPASSVEKLQCTICQKIVNVSNLHQHMIVHRAAKFKCDYCDQKFKHKQSLNRHLQRMHLTTSTTSNSVPNFEPPHQFESNPSTGVLSNECHRQLLPKMTTSDSCQIPRLTPEEEAYLRYFYYNNR